MSWTESEWLPDSYWDVFWLAVAPITTLPMAIYYASAYLTDDWRYGKPDVEDNVRNALVWAGIGGSVFAWNAFVHPGKYPYMSPASAFKTAAHVAAPAAVPAALVTLAVGSAAGYVATSDVHKGATGMLLGDMNVGVPVTTDSSNWLMNPPTWREFLHID